MGKKSASSDPGSKSSAPSSQLMDNGVNAYIEACDRYRVPVDMSVVVAIKTATHTIKPSNPLSDGTLLTLWEWLRTSDSKHVKCIHLSGGHLGYHGAILVRHMLEQNTSLETIDLCEANISVDGVKEIAEGLKRNQTLKRLDLSGNEIGTEGGYVLADTIADCDHLTFLDISRTTMGFEAVKLIQDRAPEGTTILSEGNFVIEEVLNSISHGFGLLLAIIGSCVLIKKSWEKTNTHVVGSVIFSFSLVLLYASSTFYHSFFQLKKTKDIFQILDHCAIFVLIAGTHTPLMMVNFSSSWLSYVVLAGEWGMALLGIVVSIYYIELEKLSLVLYILMGWLSAFIVPFLPTDLTEHMDVGGLWLIAAGGIAYSAGIPFFILGDRHPKYHAIWHLFVLLGSVLHYFAVLHFVVPFHFPRPHFSDLTAAVTASIASEL